MDKANAVHDRAHLRRAISKADRVSGNSGFLPISDRPTIFSVGMPVKTSAPKLKEFRGGVLCTAYLFLSSRGSVKLNKNYLAVALGFEIFLPRLAGIFVRSRLREVASRSTALLAIALSRSP